MGKQGKKRVHTASDVKSPRQSFAAKGTAFATVITYYHSVWLLTGRFHDTKFYQWIVPGLSLLALLPLFWNDSGRELNNRWNRFLPIAAAILILSALVCFSPGLKAYLPANDGSALSILILSLALSLPIACHSIWMILFLSTQPPAPYLPLLSPIVLVPFNFLWIISSGMLLTLPAGPLCDEGMILFMEGGCDMGASNIFFFAKLGMLAGVNLIIIVAMRHALYRIQSFLPYIPIALILIFIFRDDTRCDTYGYGHPQGSLGQAVVEVFAFGLLGLGVIKQSINWAAEAKLTAILAWNGIHVGLFYLFLQVVPHWSWAHTGLLTCSMLILCYVLWRLPIRISLEA